MPTTPRPPRATAGAAAEAAARAPAILAGLERLYPDADCELVHVDPFQLLVATILSAQTTDRAVNQVTPGLFARFPEARALAVADPLEVEPLIATIGLFRNKARSVVGAARALVELHGGAVPREREALEALPGVGRKTASVVLSTAFREPALAVDTHVIRLAGKLGLSAATDPRRIEDDLTRLFPRERWGFVSHALIWHGRRVCEARAPRCETCGLAPHCPSAFLGAKRPEGKKRRPR